MAELANASATCNHRTAPSFPNEISVINRTVT
jgi:hypothetical protein